MAPVGGLRLPVMDKVPESYQDDPTAETVDQVPMAAHLAGLHLRVSERCSNLSCLYLCYLMLLDEVEWIIKASLTPPKAKREVCQPTVT